MLSRSASGLMHASGAFAYTSMRAVAAAPAFAHAAQTARCVSSSSHSQAAAAAAAASAASADDSILTDLDAAPARRVRPVTTRAFTNATLRRQALAQTQPWYIGSTEFRKLQLGGFGESVQTKLPFELREHKPDFQMRKLRAEEVNRLKSDPARVIEDFAAGDKIVVTKYLSLNDRTKFERIAGLCLARQGGDRLSASFLMRSHKLGEDYELRFPLWSPFIARITMVEKSPHNFRQKMYYLRDGPRTNWEVKIPTLSKPNVAPMTVDRVVKDSAGKVQVLSHFPMKKQLKVKRGGGIGAELAAAGGATKAPAGKAAPPKKK